MKWKKPVVVLLVAVLHFALSFGMAIWTMGIALAHDDYGSPPFNVQENAVVSATAIINLPLVTMREKGLFEFPIGNWWYVLFIADSCLWAAMFALLLRWLFRKIRMTKMPNKASDATSEPAPGAGSSSPQG